MTAITTFAVHTRRELYSQNSFVSLIKYENREYLRRATITRAGKRGDNAHCTCVPDSNEIELRLERGERERALLDELVFNKVQTNHVIDN